MNYSTFPDEDQSGIPKINLLYNEKKNNRAKPSMPYLKKRNDSTKKVNFTNKESERTMEHFSNPRSKKKKKPSDKENFISPQNLENENTTSVDSSKDLDSNSVDDNDTPIEEVTEKVPEEIEKKKIKKSPKPDYFWCPHSCLLYSDRSYYLCRIYVFYKKKKYIC